jgi:hypothetical protein
MDAINGLKILAFSTQLNLQEQHARLLNMINLMEMLCSWKMEFKANQDKQYCTRNGLRATTMTNTYVSNVK